MFLRLGSLAFGLLSAGLIISSSLSGDELLVLSKGEDTLAIVDAQTLTVLGKAPIGPDPHEVIASDDGKFAYVSNYGFGAYHTLAVVDLKARKAMDPIDLGPLLGPHGLTFAAGKVWFTAEGAKAVGRYDPKAAKIDWILGTGQNRTHMIYVTPDLKHIFTTNVSSGTVTIFQKNAPNQFRPGPPPGAAGGPGGPPAGAPHPPPGPRGVPGGDWDEVQIPVGPSSEGFDVTPDGKQLWAANAETGAVSIVDLQANKLADTLQVGARGANRLKFTPDGKLIFISSLSNTGLIILDAATRKEVKRIPTAHGAAGIQMEPTGSRAFVACTGENYVAVIDLKTLEIVNRIDAGPQPDGLAWVRDR